MEKTFVFTLWEKGAPLDSDGRIIVATGIDRNDAWSKFTSVNPVKVETIISTEVKGFYEVE